MSWNEMVTRCAAGDRTLFLLLAPLRTSSWGRFWNRTISHLADGPLYALLAVLPLLLGHAAGPAFLMQMALGFALELPAYKLIKHFCRRPRPCHANLERDQHLMPVPDQYSFPSGHTAGAFVLLACCRLFFPGLAFSAWLFALSVAYSRVYNRLHFPLDTLAGAALGTACVALSHPLIPLLLP